MNNNDLLFEGAPFSADEYKRRLQATQRAMRDSGLDGLLVFWPENITYLSGFNSVGYFGYQTLIVPSQGEPAHVIRRLERDNVTLRSTIDLCFTYGEGEGPIEATLAAIHQLNLANARIGVELDGWFLTTKNYFPLAESVELIDGSQIVNKVRLVKSTEEIDYIKKAVPMMEAGFLAAVEACRVGATENDVAAALLNASIKEGSEYTGHAPLVASGPRSQHSFATWNRRELERGDLIMLEPAAALYRYHAMILRPVSLGEPSSYVCQLAEASIAGLEEAIAEIRPGLTGEEVDSIAKQPVKERGLGDYSIGRSGYSLGIGFPPDWGEGRTYSVGPGENKPLQEGMVLHLMNPVQHEGVAKVSFSETVVVTADGCEVLTTIPRELIVK